MPAQIKVKYSSGHTADAAARKKKGKCTEGDDISDTDKERNLSNEKRLATLDIFAGCGGLSEGLQQSGNLNYTTNKQLYILSTHNLTCVTACTLQELHQLNGLLSMKNQPGMRLKLIILTRWCLLTIAMLFLGKLSSRDKLFQATRLNGVEPI